MTVQGPITPFPIVNSFTIASIPMPGKWTLMQAPRMFGWQIQMGYGLDGAFVLPKGDPLVVAKFKGEFWDAFDFAIYKEVRKKLLDRGAISLGGIAAALGIHHPELKALGVTDVVVLQVDPCIQSRTGLWTTEVHLLQYRPPKPAIPKPAIKIPDVAVPINPALQNMRIEAQRIKDEITAKKAVLAG